MKACTACTQMLPVSAFSKRLNGLQPLCKACVLAYQRSHAGKLIVMFNHQKSSSKLRNHPPPSYTKAEFCLWAEAKGYALLHTAWEESGFQKRMAPSADRLNDSLPYTLGNLQLVTFGQNHDKETQDFISGKLVNRHTPIRQLTKEGELVAVHVSQRAAARATGIPQGNICTVCRSTSSRNKSAGGFKWEFVNV